MSVFAEDVQALALAHYFIADAVYAEKAATQVRAWFLAPRRG